MSLHDTIVAPATAIGPSGVAIVRLSGPDAVNILSGFCRLGGENQLDSVPARTLFNCTVMDGDKVLDRGLLVRFDSPASFTGELVVELHLHGNPLIVERVLSISIERGGRAALAGEFTQRALAHGKLDLVEVEALAEIVRAESIDEIERAQSLYGGHFGRRVAEIRDRIIYLLAQLELGLDFVEEGYEFVGAGDIRVELTRLQVILDRSDSELSRAERPRTNRFLLAGRPNAGKSSLFNALVGYERALVSGIAGTTRDYIEGVFNSEGRSIRILDTAGIRHSSDEIEMAGIGMVRRLMDEGGIILWVIDGSLSNEHLGDQIDAVRELCERYNSDKVYGVVVKQDLGSDLSFDRFSAIFDDLRFVGEGPVSSTCGSGVESLVSHLVEISRSLRGEAPLFNERQSYWIRELQNGLERVLNSVGDDVESEVVSAELRSLLHPLGELSGAVSNEDVLDSVFGDFCIGK